MTVRAAVALDADRSHIGEKHHRALPDGPIQPGGRQFLADHGVRAAQDRQPVAGHFPDDADGEDGTGKRLTPDELLRQPELRTDLPHFVLEERPQRLNEPKPKIRRQTADIVM